MTEQREFQTHKDKRFFPHTLPQEMQEDVFQQNDGVSHEKGRPGIQETADPAQERGRLFAQQRQREALGGQGPAEARRVTSHK